MGGLRVFGYTKVDAAGRSIQLPNVMLGAGLSCTDKEDGFCGWGWWLSKGNLVAGSGLKWVL